jgi:hypothetical protein
LHFFFVNDGYRRRLSGLHATVSDPKRELPVRR